MKPSSGRRSFIKKTLSGVAGITVASGLKVSAESANPEKEESKVITRKLGNTGIVVPIVSMGCSRVDSPAVIKGALKVGISHFDTANGYQKGNSEKSLGKILKNYPRDSYTIATKVKPTPTKEEYLQLFDKSLERLQMDYVDILYLHSCKTREDAQNPIMLEVLKEIKLSGKAKHIGLSTHKNEPEVIQAAIDAKIYEVVLLSINFKQEHYAAIKEKVALANKNGIGIVAMKVMAGGFLDKEKQKPVNYKAAMKWVLQDKNVHTAIPSIINLEQLQDNAQVLSNLKLTEEELSDLDKAMLEAGLYCNGCEMCKVKCKMHLPIPDLMRAYMYNYGYQEGLKAKELIATLNTGKLPCGDCHNCEVQCVKGFNVAEKINDISRLIDVPDEFLT